MVNTCFPRVSMQPESLHNIGNQKRPSLVTELSANPIGNQKLGFLVTDCGSTESGGAGLPVKPAMTGRLGPAKTEGPVDS